MLDSFHVTMSNTSGVHVWLALWKATCAIEVHAGRSGVQLQMCRSDFAILEALLQKGPLPVNTLGRKILLTSGSVTTAVSRLEIRNLVKRQWQQEDRRVCLVELTDEGRALIENASDDHSALMEAACSGLSRAERKVLFGLLKKLESKAESLVEKESTPAANDRLESKSDGPAEESSSARTISPITAAESGFAGFTDLD